MSLDQLNVVDAMGVSKADDAAVLNLFDSWDWNDEHEHLLALQEKLNGYLEFVQTGQILEYYPAARGRQLRIEIMHRFPLPPEAVKFLEMAKAIAAQIDVNLVHYHRP